MNTIDKLKQRLSGKNLFLEYAAEAGSRAWGFASPDSDYDIRFVFSHHQPEYLKLQPPSEQIDYKDGLDDVSGWDIRKTLLLAHKSNPSLIEWLKSPIVYHNRILRHEDDNYCLNETFSGELLKVIEQNHSPRALAHHYINFMRNIRGKYLEAWKGEYTLKRYFYALRPIFVVLWMRDHPGQMPPVEFESLLTVAPFYLQAQIKDLLEKKRTSAESMNGKGLPELDAYIQLWYDTGHDIASKFEGKQVPLEPFDAFFNRILT